MLCEKCKIREANIKYTEIINGVKTEHNLCSHCAREMDFGQYTAMLDGEFPLGQLLSGLLGLEEDEEENDARSKVVCPTCGTSFDEFVDSSRFGCPDCYGVFDLFIKDQMKQLQGSEEHKGKQPKYCSIIGQEPQEEEAGEGSAKSKDAAGLLNQEAADSRQKREISRLEAELKSALSREDYETAAGLRDEIRALKAAEKKEEGRDE